MPQAMLIGAVCVVLAMGNTCADDVVPPAPGRFTGPVSVRIAGNLTLSSISETTQLLAMVLDPLDKEKAWPTVTWTSSQPTMVSIQPTGLATVVDYGIAEITAVVAHDGRTLRATATVTAMPPGAFMTTGRVREPASGPLFNFPILEVSSARTRRTDNGGVFTMAVLSDGSVLRFARDGYETVDRLVRPNQSLDVPVQRVIRLDAPGAVNSRVAPNDASHQAAPGIDCEPCKLIRIASASAGTIDLRLSWTAARPVSLWAHGSEYPAPSGGPREILLAMPVGSGETIVYVSAKPAPGSGSPVSFSLTASVVR